MLRKLMAVMVWAAGVGAAGAVSTELPEDAVLWSEARGAQVHKVAADLGERVYRAAIAGRAAQALELLQAEADPLVRESAVADLLTRLQHGAPPPAIDLLVDWAASQPVQVFRQHEETRAKAYLPMFDIAQRARDLDRLWAEAAIRDDWVARWRTDPNAALAEAATLDEARVGLAGEALLRLSPKAFAGVRETLADTPGEALPAPIWLFAAQRHPDPEYLEHALDHGGAASRQRAIQLAAELPADAAERVLAAREADPALGSAATLVLVPRLLEAGRIEALRDRLADPARRDSTAAALARLADDPEHLDTLDALHAGLSKSAERGGWRRVLILIDDGAKRARWALPAEVQP
ncbi:hypothetical protein [Pseudomarimonas salicorniae]|uniref:HEAT repeat-containing protein n=1 Tax=Pseudomarimonas salicorniae TaxID=2933270 RepID=A0ABT0GJS4_9GAMM|nr:hypothetical protein [Lysobacter sp. CAU 1642]MCK7594790.1 hypothetical protein [Lysobacter sp. CAU 1642]